MKQTLSILLVMTCFYTMAQKPMVVRPVITTVKPVASQGSATDNKYKTNPGQVELQKKATERIQTEAQRVDKLLAATLVEITTYIDDTKSDHKVYYDDLRFLFKEIKFTIYAGSKGIIVEELNTNTAINQSLFLHFKPQKTITYKDLINQNVAFKMDLTKPQYPYFKCSIHPLKFHFSDGTIVDGYFGGSYGAKSFKTTGDGIVDPELHVFESFPQNLFKDPRQ